MEGQDWLAAGQLEEQDWLAAGQLEEQDWLAAGQLEGQDWPAAGQLEGQDWLAGGQPPLPCLTSQLYRLCGRDVGRKFSLTTFERVWPSSERVESSNMHIDERSGTEIFHLYLL